MLIYILINVTIVINLLTLWMLFRVRRKHQQEYRELMYKMNFLLELMQKDERKPLLRRLKLIKATPPVIDGK